MRKTRVIVVVAVAAFLVAARANTQQKQTSDSEYMVQALSAAPEAVAKGAAVVRFDEKGSMRTLRPGAVSYTHLTLPTICSV